MTNLQIRRVDTEIPADPQLRGFCYCYCLHEHNLKITWHRWTAQGQGFSHAQCKSSLAHGLGASGLTLVGTSASTAVSELNETSPSSRLACFGML